MKYLTYNSDQIHALIAKYNLEHNISELINIATELPKFESMVRDIIKSYVSKQDRVTKRLKEVGL